MEIFAGDRILNDVARDLQLSLAGSLSQEPLKIHLGIHNGEVSRLPGEIVIGVQTEHFATADGQGGWIGFDREKIRQSIGNYDYIIDLSLRSQAFYLTVPNIDMSRVYLGPYVFPEAQPILNANTSDAAIFFGKVTNRGGENNRAARLAKYQETHQIHVNELRFGLRLDNHIKRYGLVANVHSVDGIYTEVPRFLKAYLNGTVVLSEPLDAPFTAGKHYVSFQQPPPSLAQRQAILDAIHLDFAPYRLAPLLRRILQSHAETTAKNG